MAPHRQRFLVRYQSFRALDADHAAYFTHGGMVVPLLSAVPARGDLLEVLLQDPEGTIYSIPCQAGHHLPKRGFMIAFEAPAFENCEKLAENLASDRIRARILKEANQELLPPEASIYQGERSEDSTNSLEDDEELRTDPGFALPNLSSSADTSETKPLSPTTSTTKPRPKAFQKHPLPQAGQTVIRRAGPGDKYEVVILRYLNVTSFLPDGQSLEERCQLSLPIEGTKGERNQIVKLRVILPGHNVFEMWAVLEQVEGSRWTIRVDQDDESYRKACLYPTSISARSRLQREQESGDHSERNILRVTEEMPDEDLSKMPIRRRLARMGMDDKINLALSGGREERMALAMDSNKAIHMYLLKNAKITIDEISFMARLPSMNPDVLDKIAENPAYTQNPSVTKALVFNPKTPVRTAVRLLDRLPRNELVTVSKRTSMNQRLVMAAKNKLARRRW